MKRLEQEEIERNKESTSASFYFGANAKLGELFGRAKSGDVDAARMLLGCLTHNVGEFEKFCSSKIGIAKRIVVVGESWPLLHTDLKAKDGNGAKSFKTIHTSKSGILLLIKTYRRMWLEARSAEI
jgi:hypothetical protein